MSSIANFPTALLLSCFSFYPVSLTIIERVNKYWYETIEKGLFIGKYHSHELILSTPLSYQIARATKELKFSVDGQIDQSLTIHLPISHSPHQFFGYSFPLKEEIITLLKSYSKIASFGLNEKEVIDEKIRKAYALSPDKFQLNWHPSQSDILTKIHKFLMPNAKSIKAELYKLNIYETGGHFQSHVDTPRGQGHFGTLIICLPNFFTGGILHIKNIQYDWSLNHSLLNWCAFYGDCHHVIDQVTSGNRITLAYNLYSEEFHLSSITTINSKHYSLYSILRFIRDKRTNPTILGYWCQHGYSHTSCSSVKNLNVNDLKGVDAFIYQICVELNLKCDFVAVLQEYGSYLSSFQKISTIDYDMEFDTLEDYLHTCFSNAEKINHIQWINKMSGYSEIQHCRTT